MKNFRRNSILGNLQQRRHKPDYWLVILSTALLVIGLIVVYAISPGLSIQKHVGDNYFVGKQLVAILLGILAFLIVANIPISLWRKLERPLIIGAVGAAIAVRLFGERVNGAYRWIQIGGLSFQAVELIKFTLIIWLAGFLYERLRRGELGNTQKTLKPFLLAVAAVGFVVAFLQSDLGSTGVIVVMMGVMAFVVGLPFKKILMIGGIVLIGAVMLVSTSSYRRDRLTTFLHPANDCQ